MKKQRSFLLRCSILSENIFTTLNKDPDTDEEIIRWHLYLIDLEEERNERQM